jgi:NHLM bacteriocin system ABC transporter ATP-binding protein
MSLSTASIEEIGTILQPAENNLFDLSHSDTVWIVLEGKIDLFICAKSPVGEPGARYHFLRVEQGNAVFGIDLMQRDTSFFASALPSTKLLRLPLRDLVDRIAQKDDVARVLMENWITAVSTRLCAKRSPSSCVDAASESVFTISESTKAVIAAEGVTWVCHKRGDSLPLGDTRLVKVNGAGYFPVSRAGWLQPSASSELHAVSTFSLNEVDPSWHGLQEFHSFAERLLIIEREESLASERNRIRQRSSVDAALLGNALRRLTAPIEKANASASEEGNCSHPIFVALQRVADEIGMTLTAPASMMQTLEVQDPIGLIAKTSGVRVRRVALKGDWHKHLSNPLLCFVESGGRPIALLIKSSKIQIFDPAAGTLTALDDKLASEIHPIAYSLYRTFPSKALSGLDLLKFGLCRCKSDLLLIGLTGSAIGALTAINPYITGVIIDRVIPGAAKNDLLQMSLLLLVVAVATSLFGLVRGFATIRLQSKMDADLQAAVWDRLLALPVSFFRDFSAGDLAQRSMGISQIREVMTGSVLNAALSAIFSVFSFGLLFFYSLELAFVAASLAFVASAVSIGGGLAQLRYGRQIQRVSGELSSKLLQFVSGIAKLKVSGTEGRAFAAWAREFSRQKQSAVATRRLSNILIVFNGVFPTISLIVIFYANAQMPNGGQKQALTTGEFLAFVAAFTQFLTATLALSGTLISILSVVPVYERTRPILETLPESSQAKSAPGILSGEIEISHLSFQYRADSPMVLRDLTLKIPAGQAVAFVGPSGCGKSTLFRMLLGFETPSAGKVYYDGQDLSGTDVQAVRRQIGVVLQTSKPISGSIFENIVGSSYLTIDDAWEACRLAGLDEDIKRMPMGLHTMVSDGGGGISGGQRQRLMIARAIVTRPRILLFDEATSALDNRTQAIVSHSLVNLQATRIVIAHRLSTVINMDRIFVLNKGGIAENGTYQELMERKGMFYELAKRQLT